MIYVTGKHPHHARVGSFDTRWRGLDSAQVHNHLNRMADELVRLRGGMTMANIEVERIRQALRQWQSRHAGCRFTDLGPRNSRWRR
ncbi:DivIVA domain-containing protein [Micromonospora sp. NPDC005113]